MYVGRIISAYTELHLPCISVTLSQILFCKNHFVVYEKLLCVFNKTFLARNKNTNHIAFVLPFSVLRSEGFIELLIVSLLLR